MHVNFGGPIISGMTNYSCQILYTCRPY